MSEGPGRRDRWVDPRFREVVASWEKNRVERIPGKRPRRVCPHGSGVTLMVDLQTRMPRNIQCGACSSPELSQ